MCNNDNRTRFNGLFQDNLGNVVPEGQTILHFTEASDDGVAVARGGLYASHLYLAADR